MAIVFTNGVFDLLHEGHLRFLEAARYLGGFRNRLIVAVNDDESAKLLKSEKWGPKYPQDTLEARLNRLKEYADGVIGFSDENELRSVIRRYLPCVIVKGPDYVGKPVTGSEIAPVVILDTPETSDIQELKRRTYAR